MVREGGEENSGEGRGKEREGGEQKRERMEKLGEGRREYRERRGELDLIPPACINKHALISLILLAMGYVFHYLTHPALKPMPNFSHYYMLMASDFSDGSSNNTCICRASNCLIEL